MDPRRLLHPLPLCLFALFLAVAIGDLVRDTRNKPLPPPKTLGLQTPRFHVREPVIDFRNDRTERAIELLPIPEFVGGQWSAPKRPGVWARGLMAELAIDLSVGGHRVLVVEASGAGGRRPVRTLKVTLNGIECGSAAVESGWRRYVFELPAGAMRAGHNRIVFQFPDRGEKDVMRRALLIRRLGIFFDVASDAEALDLPRPIVVDASAGRVAIRRSGSFELPLTLDDRTDALKMRYRFTTNAGRAELTVGKLGNGTNGAEEIVRVVLDGEQKPSGRVRIPLHGRRGEFLFRIDADLGELNDAFLVSSLRLVEEKDPSRLPSVRSRSPN